MASLFLYIGFSIYQSNVSFCFNSCCHVLFLTNCVLVLFLDLVVESRTHKHLPQGLAMNRCVCAEGFNHRSLLVDFMQL